MNDLEKFFNENPLNLADQDIDVIIAGLRQMRTAYNQGDKKAGSTKPAAKRESAPINIDDL